MKLVDDNLSFLGTSFVKLVYKFVANFLEAEISQIYKYKRIFGKLRIGFTFFFLFGLWDSIDFCRVEARGLNEGHVTSLLAKQYRANKCLR